MVNDTVSDTLIRIKNGYLADKESVIIPYSKISESLVNLMVKNKFIAFTKVEKEGKHKVISATLLYNDNSPSLIGIERVSKPSYRVYVKSTEIPKVFGGLGITIVSTPKGLMIGNEARKQKMGGEVLCKIW